MRRLPLLLLLLLALPAQAQQPSFIARVYPPRVGFGEAFVVEVTLSLEDGRVESYQKPDFRGARILSEQPSQSTQIQMGGGGSSVQTVYSWHYELEAQQKGTLSFGAARVKVNGREFHTGAVGITVGEAPTGAPRPPPQQRRGASPFGGLPFGREPPQTDDGRNFIRVIPSKTKAYVGEQITVEWYLYLVARQDKYQPISEPRTDGFWAEELPVANNRGMQLEPQTYEGREYLVAPLLRKALFPLQPGRLTVTPMESEISQVDFFGSTLRTQRIKAEPLLIEAQPLPTAGQPRGFDPAAVGRFTMDARVDRDQVAVGDAVTLTITLSGQGNVRKLPPPTLGKLEGWKLYDPKVSINLESGDVVRGTKTVEYLLLPEKAGTTTIPAFSMPFFDPAAQSYVVEKTLPIKIEVSGEASPAAAAGGRGKPLLVTPAGGENVLGVDIRPLHARPSLRRDLGTTFYRSRFFLGFLLAPPIAFGLTAVVGRIRERLARDTEGARRRRLRRLVRRRLGAAEKHMQAGRPGFFFIEIDRVLREFLTGKLGRPVTGLSRDELRSHLTTAGLPGELVDRTIDALEECDRARFAPGSATEAEMRAALDRAGEVILQIERARLREVEA
jgi:BatD DUF11 like domain